MLLTYDHILTENSAGITSFLEINNTPATSISLLWETLKAVLQGQIIAIAARFNRDRHDLGSQLEIEVKELEDSHKHSSLLVTRHQLTKAQEQLKVLDMGSVEYALLCVKQNYYMGGTRQAVYWPTAFMLRQAVDRRVNELTGSEGPPPYQNELIDHMFERFYATLY